MSPHARGLHPEPDRVVHVHGIIPARAGFTCAPPPGLTPPPDHPRSRGVYPGTSRLRSSQRGSSPLARGLHRVVLDPPLRAGIIPARAGFTRSVSDRPHMKLGDHPRSRGVYHSTMTSSPYFAGSSPLARGLRIPVWRASQTQRIIPARAGFTDYTWIVGNTGKDHPRSRGVYKARTCEPVYTAGSSPLARGLR